MVWLLWQIGDYIGRGDSFRRLALARCGVAEPFNCPVSEYFADVMQQRDAQWLVRAMCLVIVNASQIAQVVLSSP